ncbi:MAG TPA: elongation factor G [Thermoguttaceae bacterium]|nr:elongation factor G [Thermoguttaceae bacterium]
MDLVNVRNIGISAHIDSGKTTLSERVLFYTGRIHRVGEVRGGGATMDHMELEKERGITITSAATTVQWHGTQINLIDTPGHVDFTVEVERSLRVLDGAVLVLCAVGGVQAQSITIDRQMRRYGVPRIAFVNKMDRTGADPHKVAKQLREKLDCDALLMQWPIGAGADFEGLVDLVERKALYFDGDNGETIREEPVPAHLVDEVEAARAHLLEGLAMYSDPLMEMLLSDEEPPTELIHEVTKAAVLRRLLTPVFLGTAYRNKGVQPLLDAVARYLPSPLEAEISALKHDDPQEKIPLRPEPNLPTVAMAFKIAEDPYGALTFMRIYQGRLAKGGTYYNQRDGRRERFSRIVRMHADQREDVDEATAGDIVAVLGADCASGDTYASEYPYCTLQQMHVPEPVIKVAIRPRTRDGADRLSKALHRFRREDPTLLISGDAGTGETIMAGMGELHLEVYVERIRREYQIEVDVDRPKVHYREAPTQPAAYNIRHKKQTGGSGQFAHIVGKMRPLTDEDEDPSFVFEDHVVGGRVPKQYIPSVEKGFRKMLNEGTVAGYPVVGLHVTLEDGSYHDVDSSDLAFQKAAQRAMREVFPQTRPVLLEPLMSIEIECPREFHGTVVGDLTSRRGILTATNIDGATAHLVGEVPLAETFGYATDLRSMTQGQGTFTMEFNRYKPVPAALAREVIAERAKTRRVTVE